MKSIVNSSIVLFISFSCAYADTNQIDSPDPNIDMQIKIEEVATEIENLPPIEIQVENLIIQAPQEKPTDTQKPTFMKPFHQFAQYFITILTSDKIQSSIKLVEKMVVCLLKTAFQLIRSHKIDSKNSHQRLNLLVNPGIQRAMIDVIKRTDLIKFDEITKKQSGPHGPKCTCKPDNKDKIMEKIAEVADKFSKILENPNDEKNVTSNAVGMLSSMISIAAEAMKTGSLDADAQEAEISAYVSQLDNDFKNEIAQIIQRTVYN